MLLVKSSIVLGSVIVLLFVQSLVESLYLGMGKFGASQKLLKRSGCRGNDNNNNKKLHFWSKVAELFVRTAGWISKSNVLVLPNRREGYPVLANRLRWWLAYRTRNINNNE